MTVKYSEVLDAHGRIADAINKTPVMTSRTLNEWAGASVFLKCENYQRMGAFKFRGAYNTIIQLSEEEKRKGVITHSSGNHAQAVALSCKLLGIKAVIVMPENSPLVKVNATRGYGADVVFCKNNVESREQTARSLIEQHGYTMVHPYDNDNIIRGAGTAALELVREIGALDAVFCPVGGGGLLSGTVIATKGASPGAKVIAVEPENANDAYLSFKAGKIITNKTTNTIADGLRTNLCERTFAIIKEHVDDIITVSEQEIIDALEFLWERMKIVVEPSGAVAVAGVISGMIKNNGKKVGAIISGGNIDLGDIFAMLERSIS